MTRGGADACTLSHIIPGAIASVLLCEYIHLYDSRCRRAASVRGRRPRSAAVRQRRRAVEIIADLGTLVLLAWPVPFVIVAIASPIVIILWAALARSTGFRFEA